MSYFSTIPKKENDPEREALEYMLETRNEYRSALDEYLDSVSASEYVDIIRLKVKVQYQSSVFSTAAMAYAQFL